MGDLVQAQPLPAQLGWYGRPRGRRTFPENTTYSGIPIQPVYGPEPGEQPGQYPYTRGIYREMYRKQLWTRRQYAGYGVSTDMNAMFRELFARGQTGLSIALDLPTQLGLDSDHPESEYEVGRVGVAICSVDDMLDLFQDIPLEKARPSFTINATAPMLLAMYLVAAEERGTDPRTVRGTMQNDILKEYVARGNYIFPPGHSLRFAGDLIDYCIDHAPQFHCISVSGGHLKGAGLTPVQADGIMFSNGIAYVEELLRRGRAIDAFAPMIAFQTSSYRDFFESICRRRAARRFWARLTRERWGAQEPRSMQFRVHSGGDCDAMTFERPLNNVARITLNCLANVLGGCQSMQLPCYDEPYEIPTTEAIENALDVQMIVAYETGVANVVDPLGGSYYVEALTDAIEEQFRRICDDVANTGGIVEWIESGRLAALIGEEAFRWERHIKEGSEIMVGYNFARDERAQTRDYGLVIFAPDPTVRERQLERLARLRARRDPAAVQRALERLKAATEAESNIMPPLIECARVRATLGEMVAAVTSIVGRYEPPTGL